MKIKSIVKIKGSRKEMKNRRGIFLTNIVCNLFEKVLKSRSENEIKIDEHQNGWKKEAMTGDNWFILRAVIDNNKRLRRNTYILMADAEKCFDRLWLQDCLVDMKEAGMREREIQMIYSLNKRAEIKIQTPVGETKEIEVKELVKQGRVLGPLMCCVNSARINNMKEKAKTLITPDLDVGALVYVDDIMAVGNKDVVEKIGKNLRSMEKKKKYTFNNENGKSHYMIMTTGNKEEEQELDIQVEKGMITRTREYKYLGNWIAENGTIERQLDEIATKCRGMVAEMKRIGDESKTGKMSTRIQLPLFEKTVIPVLLYNLETWTNWRKKDWEEIEKT